MTQSILPETMERNEIADMLTDETGYTVAWAILADNNGLLWIRGDYSVSEQPSGETVRVRIQRTRDGVKVFKNTLPKTTVFSRRDVSHALNHWRALPVELV